jgi:hypothetical protein
MKKINRIIPICMDFSAACDMQIWVDSVLALLHGFPGHFHGWPPAVLTFFISLYDLTGSIRTNCFHRAMLLFI